MERYTRRQVRLLVTCFVAYTAAYISRTNLSPALDAIAAHFGLSTATVGLLPTLFAIPYAAGQVVNGALADRFQARIFILIGLVGSAMMNILFSCAQVYPLLVVLWCLNGCFQSMIWTPIVRILAREFQDSIRARATFFISMTLIVGYLGAWIISGLFTTYLSWRMAFRTSGIISGVLGIGCFFALGDSKSEHSEHPAAKSEARIPVKDLLFGTDLCLLLLCCAFNGYVRDSIMNWAPKMLVDTQGIDLSGALGVILIIPIVNFLGIQFGKMTYRRLDSDVRRTVKIMMMMTAALSLILTLFYHASTLLCTLMLALCSALAYSLNPMLTSILPMDYKDSGRVAFAAGLIDATIYVGSAFSGTFAGALRDKIGWSAVFASWSIFSLIGAGMVMLAIRKTRHSH